MRTLAHLLAVFSLSSPAFASGARPTLPGLSVAGDDGAAAVWTNPANLGMDMDPSWGLWATRALDGGGDSEIALMSSAGPLAQGFIYRGGTESWWTLTHGLGFRVDRNLSFGVTNGWHIPAGPDNNFLSWDVGATWRPNPWISVAGVARDVGSPAPELGMQERAGPALTFRPWGDRLLVSADWMLSTPEEGVPLDMASDGTFGAQARLRPMRGLEIRAHADSDGVYGGGLAFNLEGTNMGAHATLPGADPADLTWFVASTDQRSARLDDDQVPLFAFDQAYPYQPMGSFWSAPGESYVQLLERLDRAAQDDDVQWTVLHLDTTPFSFAQLQELRNKIHQLQDHGKRVLAYVDLDGSNRAYMLAAAADVVLMHPAATIDTVGLSMQMQLYRETLDMVGIEPQFSKRSEYKSGPEPYTNSALSQPARDQLNELLDTLSGAFASAIATGRNIDEEAAWALIDRSPLTPDEALEARLIDGLCYPDELALEVGKRLAPPEQEGEPEEATLVEDYGRGIGMSGWPSQHEIAVIYVDGVIMPGLSSPPGPFGGGWTAGAESIVGQLGQAEEDDSVKAVVLRVDSPGGSAFASDDIWRAVEKLKGAGKPVIVSMGGVAASGGYYVSAGADAIFALPTTITGSIGVYSGKMSIGGLHDILGIHTEEMSRGRNAGMYATHRPMDEVEYGAMDRLVGDIYDQFKDKVAQGRKLSPEETEAVARGRVWTGVAAVDQGLVDKLGDLDDAIRHAASLADIEGSLSLVAYSPWAGPDGGHMRRRLTARPITTGAMTWARNTLGQALLPPAPSTLSQTLAHSPIGPALAEAELWRRLGEERVLALMPYHVEVR